MPRGRYYANGSNNSSRSSGSSGYTGYNRHESSLSMELNPNRNDYPPTPTPLHFSAQPTVARQQRIGTSGHGRHDSMTMQEDGGPASSRYYAQASQTPYPSSLQTRYPSSSFSRPQTQTLSQSYDPDELHFTRDTHHTREEHYTRSGQAYYARIVESRSTTESSVSSNRELVLASENPPTRSSVSSAWERSPSARAPTAAYSERYGLGAEYGARQQGLDLDRLAQDTARWVRGDQVGLLGEWEAGARVYGSERMAGAAYSNASRTSGSRTGASRTNGWRIGGSRTGSRSGMW